MPFPQTAPSSPIPVAIERFLLDRVATHEELQSLLTLFKAGDAALAPSEVETRAGLPEGEASEALEALVDAQLVVHAGDKPTRYRYSPARPGLDALVRMLALIHSQYRYEVVRVMAENAIKRMWSAARLAFLVALSSQSRSLARATRLESRRRRPKRSHNADTRGDNV